MKKAKRKIIRVLMVQLSIINPQHILPTFARSNFLTRACTSKLEVHAYPSYTKTLEGIPMTPVNFLWKQSLL